MSYVSEDLLYLAIYKLAGGGAMMTYDIWRQKVWLPQSRRLTGQKISELLSSVTREQVTKYFKLRHNRQDEVWEEIYKKQPELRSRPIEYALDNTSISTYSNTLSEAQYGHAKRDPELKQINYTIICDQRSGDIVFAYMYDGAVNDLSALSDILFAMQEAEFKVQGKLLVNTIGTALRMMMLCRAKQKEDRKSKLVLPGGSLDRLLAELTFPTLSVKLS